LACSLRIKDEQGNEKRKNWKFAISQLFTLTTDIVIIIIILFYVASWFSGGLTVVLVKYRGEVQCLFLI